MSIQDNDEEEPLVSKVQPSPRTGRRVHASTSDSRLRYYARLSHASPELDLSIPAHILPPSVFIPFDHLPGKYQGAIATILTMWNTMMGSSTLALPWGYSTAGMGTSIAIIMIMTAICCYTAVIIVWRMNESSRNIDFMDVCGNYLGPWARYVAWGSSIISISGAVLVYFVLMSHCLAGAAGFFWPNGAETWFGSILLNSRRTPLLLALIAFPVLNVKSVRGFVKLTSIGGLLLSYIIFFLIFTAVERGLPSLSTVPMFLPQFPYLAGMLFMGLTIHQSLSSVLMHVQPEKRTTYVIAAFSLVGCTYALIGSIAYWGFVGKSTSIHQDVLESYPISSHYPFPASARLVLLLQLTSVFPLLCFVTRMQFFGFLLNSQEYPGVWRVIPFNVVLMTCATLCGMLYPNIGTVLRYFGAAGCMVYVAILPVAVHLRWLWIERKMRWWKWGINGVIGVIGLLIFIGQMF